LLAGDDGTMERGMTPAHAVSPEASSRKAALREAMSAGEAVSLLELDRSVFDSAETEILSKAFAKAWTFVEFDPTLSMLEAVERQAELARCLMAVLKLGDSNPTSIANSAIALLRKSQSRILRRHVPRGLPNEDRIGAAR
jgi:benzoyl-CoA reductase/2-hydroxyglutaryl-CoA dehydratase subunit BcrC/BadD/HgdB